MKLNFDPRDRMPVIVFILLIWLGLYGMAAFLGLIVWAVVKFTH